jgi:hypothetical protein
MGRQRGRLLRRPTSPVTPTAPAPQPALERLADVRTPQAAASSLANLQAFLQAQELLGAGQPKDDP